MTPDEALRSHLDLQGGDAARRVLLPIHVGHVQSRDPCVGGAGRADHAPGAEGRAAMASPRPGEAFEPGAVPVVDPWWRAVAKAPAGGWGALPTATGEPEAVPQC